MGYDRHTQIMALPNADTSAGKYAYLLMALNSGIVLLGIDFYFVGTHRWRVSHNNLFHKDNNCEAAKASEELYRAERCRPMERRTRRLGIDVSVAKEADSNFHRSR
ncbi:hypothetical protein ACIP98_42060 [Streptomyces sp. NPDC088354]|uniref:hypothetical protein n=1 Tax=Streptomyces sp. NPDC088354 TaxID=3365856 RepID=UPI003804C258